MSEIRAVTSGAIKRAGSLIALGLSLFLLFPACQTTDGDGDDTTVPEYQWTWISGSDTVNPAGVYGTLGEAASTNVPGAREGAVSWVDPSGVMWLFGGYAYDSVGLMGRLNDLWKFDPGSGEWTWVSGGNSIGQAGAYGTKGVADPANVPGARTEAVSWIDSGGDLWLFGGFGHDETGEYGNLNDLWKFDPAALAWTWVSGSNSIGQAGAYGTKGTADPANIPGARRGAVSWLDAGGSLWLFGGYGHDSAGDKGWLNDLWKFDPAADAWTWMSGGETAGQAGTYGEEGTADPANVPGGRYLAVSWVDAAGILWLFGGYGLDEGGDLTDLNDAWEFDSSTLEWTWMAGGDIGNQPGNYGTIETAALTNHPGGRNAAVRWVDSSGIFWLFGGIGLDSEGVRGWLNDLWKFDPASVTWTWMSGSNAGGQAGHYGEKGTIGAANVPGARYSPVSWADQQGRLWLFGGYGLDSDETGGWLNDLWRAAK